jgi:hypothetical protein
LRPWKTLVSQLGAIERPPGLRIERHQALTRAFQRRDLSPNARRFDMVPDGDWT